MGTLSNEFKEEVKDRVDIVDVISDYVKLKKSGKNYKGLCPFHQEKTPSFTVNPANQFYHCFGCGAGGDVFSFLMEIEHITFFESLKMTAERVGMELPNQSNHQKKVANFRDKIFEINMISAKFYNYLLLKHDIGEKALAYLKNRNYSEDDIKKYSLGFAPDKWTALYKFLKNKGYTKDEMVKAGLLVKKNEQKFYDRFRNRIIFPIFNSRSEVLAFGGRIIDDSINQPKYLNSPDTMVYDKSDNLYGLNWAKKYMRKSNNAIIMEGYTDVLTAHMNGIKNAVASLGTSLTEKQAKMLKRYVSKVYIAYDSDTAGAKATLRGLEILKEEGLNVKVIKLPEDTDPDDFIKLRGEKKFLNLKDDSLSLIEFKVDNIISSKNLRNADDRINTTHKIVEVLAQIKDPIEREVYTKEIAKKIDLDTDLLYQEVEKRREKTKRTNKNNKNRKFNNYQKSNKNENNIQRINDIEKKILKSYIDYPEYRDFIKEKVNKDYFFDNITQEIWEKLKSLKFEKTPDEVFLQLENNSVKKLYMKLKVEEKSDINKSILKAYLHQFEENYRYRYKFNLYKKLQKENISLMDLNEILISYQNLFKSKGEGGI
ncbi:MAG TPA: DNA primase [Halanaerobiales bacterium]|nr:DNA primase [Halanaerobiales bacterium]